MCKHGGVPVRVLSLPLPLSLTSSATSWSMLCILAVLLLVASHPTSARSSFGANRNDVPPRGCKWHRIATKDVQDVESPPPQSILSCKLRTIGAAEALLTNLSVHQTDRITALRLECSDLLFFENSLESVGQTPGSFLGTLRRLKDLQIEQCKFRNFPAMGLSSLRDLQTLALRSRNRNRPTMNVEFHAESFRGLTELKSLDLSENNIWSFPPEAFCPLYSLRFLNLTRNRLTDIQQLGFSDWGSGPLAPGKACNTGLEVLDLSANNIGMLADHSFSALRSLQSLQLQDNSLTSLADRSFVGLQSLKVLNMSSNRLIALPPELLQAPRELQKLYLQNNTLAVLAPGLLEGLDRLEELDLSQNELTSLWINRDTFGGLIRLVVLNLASNALTKIDTQVFRGKYSLQILNLEHNLIEVIDNNAFGDLKNLHALTLSHNKLKRIEAFHMSELYVLNQLYLESNLIEEIHPRAFENLTNLKDLNLNDNQLSEVPQGLGQLRVLQSLDLGKNKIRTVQNSSFDGMDELLGLRLVDNQITNISRNNFNTLPSLHVLNLASNQIRHIDQSAFTSNPAIRAIRLDNNLLEDISSVFTSLPGLVWLNISDNRLRWFDYSHLPMSLEWLDMHKNNVSELGNYFDVRNSLQIKILDISYNKLTEIDESSIPNSIQVLSLNNNQIREVAPRTFLGKKSLEKVDLTHNNLRKIDIGSFALTTVADERDMPHFFIGHNPIHCDCNMEWLQRINELSHLRQHPHVPDLDRVMCTTELDRITSARPLTELTPADFLCKYEEHCFALCHCCGASSCDCRMTCPDRCSCYHDHLWNANIVDCGNAGYTEVPKRMPLDATVIYLDGNAIKELDSSHFDVRKKLEVLYLNETKVERVAPRTFASISNLRILHLERNKLTSLHGSEFEQLNGLTELYLDHNAIASVGNQTFAKMRDLEVLTLSENRIVDFVPWQQLAAAAQSGALSRVALDGNKWRCDCDALGRLQEWIRDVGGEFDVHRMVCSDNRVVGEVMKWCGDSRDRGYGSGSASGIQRTVLLGNGLIGGGYVPLLAAILVAIIGTALLVALACVFRQDVRLWAHSRYGIRLFKDPTVASAATMATEKEKLYDAYAIYSVRDSEFVNQIIASELQHSGYTMCLHHRDVHATTFLADSLQSAADASRKVIVLVSVNFLQTEWAQPQFRVALQSVIESIRPTHRCHKLVLILTAPVELVAMDPVMQILIRTCTVICWGEKRFWDKLRFALPDLTVGRPAVKLGSVTRPQDMRYAPAPTTLDSWYRLTHQQHQQQLQQQQQQQQQHQQHQQQQQQQQHHHHQQIQQQQQQQQQHLQLAPRNNSHHHSLHYNNNNNNNNNNNHHHHHHQLAATMPPSSHQLAQHNALANGLDDGQPMVREQVSAPHSPSQSTSNTEDELSTVSSQHYEPAPSPGYMSRSTASLGHVYSTIPEGPHPSGVSVAGGGGGSGVSVIVGNGAGNSTTATVGNTGVSGGGGPVQGQGRAYFV